LVVFLSILLASALLGETISPVKASLSAESASAKPGQGYYLDLILDIEPGWHVYGAEPKDTGLPTKLGWELPPGFSALPTEWPKPESFSQAGIVSEGYSGRLVLRTRIIPPAVLVPGGSILIKAKVEWLACKEECMPGEASLELSLPAGQAKLSGSLLLALLLAFAGGLILNLMPCVLPVLSLKALSFAPSVQGARDAKVTRPLAKGLYFTAGVLVSFWLLALILLALRAGGGAIGWGFQLQDPAFVAAAALVFFLMALNLFGLFELGTSLTRLGSLGSKPGRGGAAASSFLGGLFATAVATPCTAPFMGVALGYALTHDAASAFGVFTALGLGLAAPLLAISALPGLARRLPKAGAWTAVFRQVLAFPMMAAAIWMAATLSSLGGAPALVSLLEGFLAAGAGAWVWGSWGGMGRPRRVRIAAAAIALALVAGGAFWSMRGNGEAGRPSLSANGRARAAKPADPFWSPWGADALADLRKRGLPVFVDFGADWCLSCQVNEALALGDAAVRKRFAELGVVALKADWTARDESIARGLAELGRASVPLYALYLPGVAAPLILPEILTPGIVLRYLDENLARR
jgi:thiol:disulfide interchange protein